MTNNRAMRENMKREGRTAKKRSAGACPIDRAAIRNALAEDAPAGDVTTEATIPPGVKCVARLIAKQDLVLAGIDLFKAVFVVKDKSVTVRKRYKDGQSVPENAVIATVSGRARSILTAERVALNYLQRLCGVATLTSRYVEAVEGTGAVILDTRKTPPGFRDVDKYAVRCGGGRNHRRDLSEMALIKDNHIAVAGGIAQAVRRVRERAGPKAFIEVEVKNRTELVEALEAGAGRVMLDNMRPPRLKQAVAIVAGRAETEASGNITLKNVRRYASAGVDFLSAGALTHSAPAADMSLLVEINKEETV